MVVQLAHAPLPVAPAVGALSLAVAGADGRPCAHAERGFALQFFDLVDMPESSSHSCSLYKVVDMPVVFNDSPWFNVQKTAVVPQLLRVFLVADVPVVQVVLVPLSVAMDAL